MNFNIIAFIPARIGSKSIPKKNLKDLGGKPLIVWSIQSAEKCGLRVIVNTDSEEIANVARGFGAEVMIRGDHLAKDETSMFEVLRHEIPKIEPKPDIVVLLQPTNPLRKKVHIKSALSYLQENPDYDSVVSVERVPEKYNPYAMILENKRMIFRKLIGWKEKIQSWFTGKLYITNATGFPISQRMTRRQDLPQAWIPTGDFYIFKAENLKKGSIYGGNVMIYECEGSPNLNTLSDWEEAEKQIK
jgi:CMP-N-acetylneuraminic acid synthetase